MLAYILLGNKTLLFPKWRHKATRPILRYSLVVNMEMCKIINFENVWKIIKNSYNDNFFHSGDQEKKEIYISEKHFLGLVAL